VVGWEHFLGKSVDKIKIFNEELFVAFTAKVIGLALVDIGKGLITLHST
jgi:hypothetical protein